MELGFRIRIFSGIPKSLSCIPDSTSKNFLDLEFRIPNMGQNISALPFGDHTCKRPTENKERRPGPGCSKVGEDNPGLV